MTFISVSLYDEASGGTLLWGETHGDVQVTDGVYSLILGNGTPLDGPAYDVLSDVPFDQRYYLELAVNGETPSPRQELTSVPYARKAASLEGLTVTADGQVGIGTTAPDGLLDVAGPLRLSSPESPLLFHGVNPTGVPLYDGFRLVREEDFWGPSRDAIVFEKTDGNAPDPDGGIAFVNTSSDGTAERYIGIGATVAQERLDVAGNIRGEVLFGENLVVENIGEGGLYLTTLNTSLGIYEDQNQLGWIRFRPYAGSGFVFSDNGDEPRLVIGADPRVDGQWHDPHQRRRAGRSGRRLAGPCL